MERAVDRLESVLAVRHERDKNAVDGIAADLSGARDEIARLKSAHQSVSTRLDETIERIRAVLGE
jgi:hypothetical protein